MELKPGYKQTEVGVIPEEWEVKQLDEIADPKRPISYGIVQTGPRVTSGVKCLRVVDIHNGQVRKDDLITTSAEISSAYKRTVLCAGDLVIALRGKIGELAVIDEDLAGANLTRGVALIAPLDSVDSSYLCHCLSSSRGKQIFEKNLNGSALQEISIATLRNIPAVVPPYREQRAIAGALGDVDALLGALIQLIAKKRDLRQAAMQQLLTGQTRLPGFSGEWKSLRMSERSTLKARIGWQGLTTAEYLPTGEYYLVTGTDFVAGHVNWATCCFVNAGRYVQDKNIQLKARDILLTKDGTIGKVGFVDFLPGPATLNSGIFVIRPKGSAYDPLFFYYILTSRVFKEFLAQLQAGSTISHLYQKDFVTFSFHAPRVPEQTAIAAVLSDMDAELAALEQRLAKTRALKQGMMQELLTGRTRLV